MADAGEGIGRWGDAMAGLGAKISLVTGVQSGVGHRQKINEWIPPLSGWPRQGKGRRAR